MHVEPIYEISEEEMSKYIGPRIFQVSNRVVEPQEDEHGNLLKVASGGLDEAIAFPFDANHTVRVGWSGETVDIDPENFDWREHVKIKHYQTPNGPITYCTVPLPQKTLDDYYNGLSNRFWWMVNHGYANRAIRPYLVKNADGALVFDEEVFSQHVDATRFANKIFAEIICDKFSPRADRDTIIANDSHVVHLPSILRELGCKCPIGYFLHTPLLDPKVFKKLPEAQQKYVMDALHDMLECDFVGFQSVPDVEKFSELLGFQAPQNIKSYESYEVPENIHSMEGPHRTRFGAFPVVGNYHLYPPQARAARHRASAYLRKRGIKREDRLIYSGGVRTDVTKGIPKLAEGYRIAAWKLALRGKGQQRRTFFLQQTQRTRPGVQDFDNEYSRTIRTHRKLPTSLPQNSDSDLDAKGRDRGEILAVAEVADVLGHTPEADGFALAPMEGRVVQPKDNPAVSVLGIGAGAAHYIGKRSAILVDGKRPMSVAAGIVKALLMSPIKIKEMDRFAKKKLAEVSNAAWQRMLHTETRRGYRDFIGRIPLLEHAQTRPLQIAGGNDLALIPQLHGPR